MKGDHYVVNGQKLWSTMGQFAQRCLLLVRTSSQDRFFQYVTPVPDNENLVETNGGGTNQTARPRVRSRSHDRRLPR